MKKFTQLHTAQWKQERAFVRTARLVMGILGAATLFVIYCLTLNAWLFGGVQ